MPRSALMAVGAVGAALAGTDCGGTMQPAPQDAAADAPPTQDASEASTSPVDASEASTSPVDATAGADASGDANAGADASQDATEDFGGGIALYGGPPPLPDGSGPVDPDSGLGG